ncbi:metallophosphoesterase [Piscibacillus sp. B03]|uniref:metallophosphoesterase n=1 Tax=Piscibacillus sp. B03 TaxID=3457430 RepID=UPI003FCEE3FD
MKRKLFYIGLLIVFIVLIVKVYMDTNYFKVNTVPIESSKMPQGQSINILQLSDLHNREFGEGHHKLLNKVESLNADLIVITGDLIDRKTEEFTSVFELVEQLTSIHGQVYFVTGNHEWENKRTNEFISGLTERGVVVLNNRHVPITIGTLSINLVGIDDESTAHEQVDKAFNNLVEDRLTILLSHAPTVVTKYDDLPADLILSGHTHGGQVRLPFVGALVAPDQGFFPSLDQGLYEIGEKQRLYIDSGLGTSVAPIRFLNPSQMSLIKINPQN